MKIVFCWADISGYMASCWKSLAQYDEAEIFVVARHVGSVGQAPFGAELMQGIPCRLLNEHEIHDGALVEKLVADQKPHIIVMSGWNFPAYRALVRSSNFSSCRFVMGMDTPLRRTMRQYVGKVLLRGFIRRMDAIMVPGERAWQYARFLGADENRIYRGLYGVDYQSFHKSLLQRRETTWPHRFLFVGRYSQEKGLDRLIAAYHKYRSAVDDPWTLTCCGKGTLGGMLQGQIGITDVGFVPPDLQPDLFAQHGTLILPSRFDPWPLVIVEACASGMPIICTQACGSAVELVRPYYNGLMCATDSADALAGDMVWIHENGNRLSEMGTASCELAAPYSAESWAFRWINMLERMG